MVHGPPSLYRPGQRVQEAAAPHRKGTVTAVKGRGAFALIWVRLDGLGTAAFRPGGLTLA